MPVSAAEPDRELLRVREAEALGVGLPEALLLGERLPVAELLRLLLLDKELLWELVPLGLLLAGREPEAEGLWLELPVGLPVLLPLPDRATEAVREAVALGVAEAVLELL